MAANLQFMTTRMTNATAGSAVDDSFADFEAAIINAFGFTGNTPISQVMSIDSGGDVTMIGDLTLSGAPTLALHCATKKYVDDNVSGWSQYLVQGGDHDSANSSEFVGPIANADIGMGVTEDWEIGAADQFVSFDRFYCKAAGYYLLYGRVGIKYSGGACSANLGIKRNGASLATGANGATWNESNRLYLSISAMAQLAVDDYIEFTLSHPEAGSMYLNGEWGDLGWIMLRNV
jgi:hypothetical protein